MKQCPYCAEDIQDAAIFCKHCKRDLVPTTLGAQAAVVPASSIPPPPKAEVRGNPKVGLLLSAVGFLLSLIGGAAGGVGFFLMWGGTALSLSSGAIVRWGGGFAIALVAATVAAAVTGRTEPSRPSSPTPASSSVTTAASSPAVPLAPPEPTYQLELLSFSCTTEHGYGIIQGQVKNVTAGSIQNAMAVGNWYTKDGAFIKSDDALLDYNPILPGQASPFKTMSSGNPAMAKCNVEFKKMFGGTFSVDRRNAK